VVDQPVKRQSLSSIANLGQALLALDLKKASTTTVAKATQNLSRPARLQLLSKLDSLLRGASRKSETERVVAAKLFVSLLPDSFGHIEKWLGKKGDRWNYEFHFSLFCYLDDSLALSLEPKVVERIETLIVEYLETAKSGTAEAAWMAADLLGHHWPGRSSLNALMSAAKQGHHVEGRKAALSGLQRRLEDPGRGGRSEIIETLQKVASNDASLAIRRKAETLLAKTKKHA
jgi:hypothetical protein